MGRRPPGIFLPVIAVLTEGASEKIVGKMSVSSRIFLPAIFVGVNLVSVELLFCAQDFFFLSVFSFS